ncbi:iron transporter [Stappia taiwanensis]|uniref:Iron transporter n=1 Tax=Stappia taiwanensis TaxID=992267 RepID=A0A838XEZ6_9HYPH|nr:iron transporter [Stappia taiwanensis]MBA4610039.1 iron transporter [Stappia taiwanensis]GGE76465.1 membrane protein [Stappia taiwanensis]
MSRKITLTLAGSLLAAAWASPALAAEYPIGAPQTGGGLEVAAVYLQPITMEPAGMMRPAADSDIHLEADIHALADNKNGLAEGEWAPYLVVTYTLTKLDSGETQTGPLMPMVASDGPHYGDNVKLMGVGKYELKFDIAPPSGKTMTGFGRHVDKETGVAPWFEPFTTTYEFVYAGVGKKGGY